VGVAIQELRPTVGVEPHDEIVAVGDRRHAGAAGQRAPLAQRFDVLGDIQCIKLATLLLEPSLGRLAVWSRGGGVDADFHETLLMVIEMVIEKALEG